MNRVSVIREEYQVKIQRRIKDYAIDIISEPRSGKKLLVLDIDYTLFGLSLSRCVLLGYSLFR